MKLLISKAFAKILKLKTIVIKCYWLYQKIPSKPELLSAIVFGVWIGWEKIRLYVCIENQRIKILLGRCPNLGLPNVNQNIIHSSWVMTKSLLTLINKLRFLHHLPFTKSTHLNPSIWLWRLFFFSARKFVSVTPPKPYKIATHALLLIITRSIKNCNVDIRFLLVNRKWLKNRK